LKRHALNMSLGAKQGDWWGPLNFF